MLPNLVVNRSLLEIEHPIVPLFTDRPFYQGCNGAESPTPILQDFLPTKAEQLMEGSLLLGRQSGHWECPPGAEVEYGRGGCPETRSSKFFNSQIFIMFVPPQYKLRHTYQLKLDFRWSKLSKRYIPPFRSSSTLDAYHQIELTGFRAANQDVNYTLILLIA